MNIMKNIFQNGSKWLRADFHLHTKADKEFPYPGDDNDFVPNYIIKLEEQDIRIGVITNHNKFDKSEFVALRKRASENGIGLFPGVEFSLKEGIHILIVFEEEWYKGEIDHINQFLDTAFYGIANPKTPPYPNSSFDLQEAVTKLDAIGCNYFIILAHVDALNGLCKVLQGRTLEAFVKGDAFDKVLAIQKSGNKESYEQINMYAARSVACVEGSDNAHEGLNGIGKGRSTYLKIGDFNFEALQYALTDHTSRLRPKDKPEVHNSCIKSISFQGGLLDGKQISFSPELNNLIGIRGSGKSAILEILRYALNIPFGSQAVDKDYKDDLIKHVLRSGGKVVVEIANRQGKIYRVERIYGQSADIYIDDELKDITLDAILQQPIYFGQKDLSNKNADFENDLVKKLIGGKLNDIQTDIDKKKREIQRIINEWSEFGNLSQLKKDTETVKINSEHKLQLFEEKGIAEKLKLQTSFDSDISCLKNRQSGIESYISDLALIIQSHEYLTNQPISSDTNGEIFEEANLILERLKSEFLQLKTILNNSQNIGIEFTLLIDKLTAKKEELKEEFARIKREINIPELNPDDFIKINRELEMSRLKLIEIDKSENKRIELKKQLDSSITELNNLWYDQYNLLKEEINKINESNGNLSIEIIFKGRKENKSKDIKENTFQTKLQESFKGSNIRENTYKEIINAYADFIDIYKDKFRKLNDILNETLLVELKKRFRANLYELLTYQVENQITIKYNKKPLKDHSLGQRASALILFLLSQKENDILIIDQPEDDLDNQTIYEDVIKEIKLLKGKMQFIFATHNANIPVLGDSEMLVACRYIPDTEIIIESGSIDCQSIQGKIIGIMEGGKEAFDIRKNIYKIWEKGAL